MTQIEAYLDSLQRFGIHPGLERVRALLACVGNPQYQYPVVLVGGTNGKGSTCEFLARLLSGTGRLTGLYTSPHLYRWNERIRVLKQTADSGHKTEETAADSPPFAGVIADDDLDSLLNAALPHLAAVAAEFGQPTEFETLTLLGVWHFARTNVDAAVVEVGLGGRWDATNAVEPAVSVITHVALDHCDRLGSTLEEIARDKVEIARPGHILVTAETKPPVLKVFSEYSATHNIRLWPLLASGWSNDADNLQRSLESTPEYSSVRFEVPAFQRINQKTAAVALRALEATRNWAPAILIDTPPPTVPGRIEVLRQRPILLIDGANNPDGAAQLAAQLRDWPRSTPASRLILVLGILADKDYAAMVEQLAPLAHTVIATRSPSPRAAPAEVVAAQARRFGCQVETVEPVAAAVERALHIANDDDIICVTGSFYTIAEVPREGI